MPLITDPRDLLLDPLTGDLVLDTDLHLSTGLEAAAQEVELALNQSKGEWFMDLDDGTPWFQDILGKKYDEASVRNILRGRILSVETVTEIILFQMNLDPATRTLSVTHKERTEFGDTETTTTGII